MVRRADFLAANRGRRAPMPGFVLLVRERGDGDPAMRYGITVTKKVGGAVIRNRMKRRFRVLARALLPVHGVAGADHVLIGRDGGIERDFSLLRAELAKALGKIMSRPVDPPRESRKDKGKGKPTAKAAVLPRKREHEGQDSRTQDRTGETP
ncbi:ribonuclease P protein component [Sphingobium sp. HBC34]|uniref:Ribonuclease P protein component n=1 Tax=Sphingobium cyanobacteriorum TaxID=3063954 RepID=A0ABT8ZIM8_9SPHN|nr:ribonuclease P protein component [Sphingobium sp. HBC34]MDO7834198.1 ribonuclease P protein component [Sphingobium sp. HBC34]